MSDYDWGDSSPVADEMSVVAEHTGSTIPGVRADAQYDNLGELEDDYFDDSGDGGDYANVPEPDPLHELAVEAFEQQLTQQEQFAAWQSDYQERHNAVMEAKAAEEHEKGAEIGDRIIDSHYGHTNTTEGTRNLIWSAADALESQHGAQLRQQGMAEADVARACLKQAADLVREAEISHHALKRA